LSGNDDIEIQNYDLSYLVNLLLSQEIIYSYGVLETKKKHCTSYLDIGLVQCF